MDRRKWWTRFLSSLVGASMIVAIASARLSPSEGTVSFQAAGPAGMSIAGKTSEYQVQDDGQTITLTVQLAKMETGIALRDRHMKDRYLEVQKNPEASLSVVRSALTFPALGASAAGDAPAQLTLHGKTNPVLVHYTIKQASAGSFQVKGTSHLNINDFGIETPNYYGIKVKPEVDFAADLVVLDR